MHMQEVIETEGLRMQYGDNVVLNGVDLTLERGEVLVLLGPNGAGKTTTLEILEGFRSRSAGKVHVLGTDPGRGDEAWRAKMGIVLQSWSDHAAWRVRELLGHFGQYYAPYATKERRPFKADELLAMVGLTAQAGKKVQELSGGQRRRLDVAIGLVGNPELLFLDEPTASFDPEARREFHSVIERLSSISGMTILLTTHDLDEAEKLSDRIMILAGGTIVANGSADQLTKEISGKTEVRWRQNGKQHTQTTADATDFTRKLLSKHANGISDLEIRRASLEDAYMAIVRKHEAAQPAPTREVHK